MSELNPRPNQRQRQLENRIVKLELAYRDLEGQMIALQDEVKMLGHHYARTGAGGGARVAAPRVTLQ